MLERDDSGLHCPRGGFWVDPWAPVSTAVLTHLHADHARPGCGRYLAARAGEPVLRRRLGPEVEVQWLEYGERVRLGDVTVSLHPAGHVLGSAQVRVEGGGETWLVSGDLKRDHDPTCAPFEVVRCDVLIIEATFALPIYRWPDPLLEIERLRARWKQDGLTLVFAYALGKAQRIAAMLGETVFAHGAVLGMVEAYRAAGVVLPEVRPIDDSVTKKMLAGALVLAPPSARGSPWMRRFTGATVGFASGWMQVRGDRRRRGIELGLVISDHADWPSLLRTIDESQASRVLVTHGQSEALARYLREQGRDAGVLETAFEGEGDVT